MKRILSVLLAAVLILGLLPVGAAFAATQYATVVGGWLRLREETNFTCETIASYREGTVVEIISKSGSWYYVRTPDANKGYMYGDYLVLSSQGGGGTGIGTATVTSENGYGVRLRTGPGTGYRRIGIYPVGTSVTVLERGTSWSRIRIGSTVGYMMNKFLIFGGSPEPTENPNATIWSRNGYGVKLRRGPDKTYSVIGVYSVGTRVRVIEYGTVWSYIQVGSRKGYMMTEFLNIQRDAELTEVKLDNLKPIVGDTLNVASITPAAATADYSWSVNGVEKGTGTKFEVIADYKDYPIVLKATGKNGYTGSVSATTEKVVDAKTITDVSLNNISPAEKDVLSIASITPEDATYTCRWYVDGTAAETGTTHLVTKEEAARGADIYVEVTGTGVYRGCTKTSNHAIAKMGGTAVLTGAKVVNVTTDDVNPTTISVGQTLRADALPDTNQVDYLWMIVDKTTGQKREYSRVRQVTANTADCELYVIISGKTGTPYAGSPNAESSRITVTSKNWLRGISVTPSIGLQYKSTDSTKLTAAVTASAAIPDTVNVVYEWQRDGNVIAGATRDTYTVTADDLGKKIVVRASIADSNWTTDTVTSTPTEKVTSPLERVKLTVNGTVVENPSLSIGDVVGLSITPANAVITSSWSIGGNSRTATNHTYTIQDSDVGTLFNVKLKVEIEGTAPYTGELEIEADIPFDATRGALPQTAVTTLAAVRNNASDSSANEITAASDGGSTDGASTDGGSTDGGSTDSGSADGVSTDGGSTDGGSTDGGSTDGGSTDGGSTDGGSTDGGSTDGGSTDGGSTDGGSTDGGSTDGGSTNGGSTDGGSTDGGSTEVVMPLSDDGDDTNDSIMPLSDEGDGDDTNDSIMPLSDEGGDSSDGGNDASNELPSQPSTSSNDTVYAIEELTFLNNILTVTLNPLTDSAVYEWYEGDVLIIGADQPTYTVSSNKLGKTFKVVVTIGSQTLEESYRTVAPTLNNNQSGISPASDLDSGAGDDTDNSLQLVSESDIINANDPDNYQR